MVTPIPSSSASGIAAASSKHAPSGESIGCPAIFISAPASNQGKTTVTAGLARYHARLGRRVRVFKTGPDYLDPMILARACGQPVYSLHLWMVGEAACRRMLTDAARDADLILIEGVMGLFDGNPSGADLARRFGVPVLAVIDGHAMAQTFGALAYGMARYQPDLPFHGVFANRIGTQSHADMLLASLPADIQWCGHMPSSAALSLPERHLGIMQAGEIDDLEARLEAAADLIGGTPLASLPPAVWFDALDTLDTLDTLPPNDSAFPEEAPLAGKRIAIARDAAFSFIYPANLDLLRQLGATLSFFSPLCNEPVPTESDALYLPGGYPELHAERLAANQCSANSVRAHVSAGKPTLAECGGMIYLLDGLTDAGAGQPRRWPMLGCLPGEARMTGRLVKLGMQSLPTPWGELRGHTFHYSTIETGLAPVMASRHATRVAVGEQVYQYGPITASYFHAYWPSNPQACVSLLTHRSLAAS